MVFFLFFGILEYDPLYPLYPLRICLFLILGIYRTNLPDDHEYTWGGVGVLVCVCAIAYGIRKADYIPICQYACTSIYCFVLFVDVPSLATVYAFMPYCVQSSVIIASV